MSVPSAFSVWNMVQNRKIRCRKHSTEPRICKNRFPPFSRTGRVKAVTTRGKTGCNWGKRCSPIVYAIIVVRVGWVCTFQRRRLYGGYHCGPSVCTFSQVTSGIQTGDSVEPSSQPPCRVYTAGRYGAAEAAAEVSARTNPSRSAHEAALRTAARPIPLLPQPGKSATTHRFASSLFTAIGNKWKNIFVSAPHMG